MLYLDVKSLLKLKKLEGLTGFDTNGEESYFCERFLMKYPKLLPNCQFLDFRKLNINDEKLAEIIRNRKSIGVIYLSGKNCWD